MARIELKQAEGNVEVVVEVGLHVESLWLFVKLTSQFGLGLPSLQSA